MAASGGHWKNLAEAQKLSQEKIVSGVIEEDIRVGGLMPMLPVMQQTGTKLQWLRETTVGTSSRAAVGDQLAWSDEFEYTKIEEALVIRYKQTPLDQYVDGVYSSFNSYAAIQLVEDRKAVIIGVEDDLIYGDPVSGPAGSQEPRGLHHLAELYPNGLNRDADEINIDMAEAGLSLNKMRQIERGMKHGIDFWLFPDVILDRLSAYLQEAGLSTNTFGAIQFTMDDLGKRVTRWNGRPVFQTDYLVAEQANTGNSTSSARAKNTSGDKQYSVFAIKMGQVARKEPGLTFAFGGHLARPGEPLMFRFFPQLEDFDASGIRNTVYYNLADGSAMAIGRIWDIENVAIVA